MTMTPFDHPFFADLLGDEEISPLFSAEAELRAMLDFEATLAEVQAEQGLISADAATAIAEGGERFDPDMDALAAGVANDGVVVPAFVKALRAAVGDPHGKSAHFGTTSQDVIDTALILRLAEVVDILAHRLRQTIALLDSLAGQAGETATIGRTRMQRAVPIRITDRIAIWREPLAAALERLEGGLAERLLVVQFAGAAGNLDKFGEAGPKLRAALAERLELGDPGRPWHADRERIVAFTDWLSHVTGACGKAGMDLVLLAQNEVAEVVLPTGGGSSAMPHKRNPILPEMLVTLARFSSTQNSGMHSALVHEFERSGMAWTLEWMILPQMVQASGRSLDILCRCLDGLKITGERPLD